MEWGLIKRSRANPLLIIIAMVIRSCRDHHIMSIFSRLVNKEKIDKFKTLLTPHDKVTLNNVGIY